MSVGIFFVKIGLKTLILDMKWSIQRVNNGFALIFVCLKGKRGSFRGGCRVRWHKIAQGLCLLCRKKRMSLIQVLHQNFFMVCDLDLDLWLMTLTFDLWPLTSDMFIFALKCHVSLGLAPVKTSNGHKSRLFDLDLWPLTLTLTSKLF